MPDPDLHTELDRLAAQRWPEVVAAIDSLVERAERGDEWQTSAHSSLSGDDAATAPYQTSHALQHLLNAGIDALNGVRHLIWGRPDAESDRQPVLHQTAHYVLARAAIENFATALWVLTPRLRADRVQRTLQWHAQNVTDQHYALNRLEAQSSRSMDERLDRLESLARKAGPLPPGFRRGYKTTAVLKYVDETHPDAGASPLISAQFVWQLCSGFSHGRPWASLTFQEQERLPTGDPDIFSVRMTSDMHRALLAPKEALHLLERLLKLHEQRNTGLH